MWSDLFLLIATFVCLILQNQNLEWICAKNSCMISIEIKQPFFSLCWRIPPLNVPILKDQYMWAGKPQYFILTRMGCEWNTPHETLSQVGLLILMRVTRHSWIPKNEFMFLSPARFEKISVFSLPEKTSACWIDVQY